MIESPSEEANALFQEMISKIMEEYTDLSIMDIMYSLCFSLLESLDRVYSQNEGLPFTEQEKLLRIVHESLIYMEAVYLEGKERNEVLDN